ncbi:hypothetical protein FO519_008177 [Halicephalobus sp. NKZ332]|nr:hypothetical protein FO519_008177 [Halicephalobus sp. NKZ332]
MTPKADENKFEPEHVTIPDDYTGDQGHTAFDWKSNEIQKWKMDAIKMQEAHVKDNNRTKWFVYEPEQRDAIELRILKNRIPMSLLTTYSRDQRKHARTIKKKIMTCKNPQGKIGLALIFVSTAIRDKNDEFLASEIPVFVIESSNGGKKYVDTEANLYHSWEEYMTGNSLPKGPMIYPENGSYVPNRVRLWPGETPPCLPGARIKAATDYAVMVVGIALSGCNLAMMVKPAMFGARALKAIQIGSYVCSGWSIASNTYRMYDKSLRNESIHTEVVSLISAVFSIYAQHLNQKWTLKMGTAAREGKLFASLGVTQWDKFLVWTVNWTTMALSATSFVSALIDFWNNPNKCYADLFNMAMSTFMFLNVLTKPKTIEGIFENEQTKFIRSFAKSKEAQQTADKMIKDHKNVDEKTYFIRNLVQMKDPNEFFEIVGSTKVIVRCTADGLVVSEGKISAITIDPKAYNMIGNYEGRLQMLKNTSSAAEAKELRSRYEKLVAKEQRTDFRRELDEAAKLPENERFKKFGEVLKNFTEAEPSNNEIKEVMQKGVTDAVNKQIMKEMGAGAPSDSEQGNKFKQLAELTTKQVMGENLSQDEKNKLDELKPSCEKHRKEYFFKTSADHASDQSTPENIGRFREKIDTFTNARNERLCYVIDMKDVDQRLKDTFGVQDLKDFKINGQPIFDKMNIGQYDRLNRVFKQYGNDTNDLLQTARTLAEDDAFKNKFNISSPQDIACLTEAATVFVKDKNNNANYADLASGNGEKYKEFRNTFINLLDDAKTALKSDNATLWTSEPSMAYHYYKHCNDFGSKLTPQQYFNEYPKALFGDANLVGHGFTQDGTLRSSYATSFGMRTHVGYTMESSGEFTEEEFHLIIGQKVNQNSKLTLDYLAKNIFPHFFYAQKGSSPVAALIKKSFYRQLKLITKTGAKNVIVEQLKKGSSEFIKNFIAAGKENNIIEAFKDFEDVHNRLQVLSIEDALGSLLTELRRLFLRLRKKLAPAENENLFRQCLIEWFKSGEMTKEIRDSMREWVEKDRNIFLFSEFVSTKNQTVSIDRRTVFAGLWKKKNSANNFENEELMTDPSEALEKLDKDYLRKKLKESEVQIIKIKGKTIFMSDWIKYLEEGSDVKGAIQVEIFAEDCFGLDCSLNSPHWQGKNFVVVTNKVIVWKENTTIKLSGTGFKPYQTKAEDARSNKEGGVDGEDGKAGESSGNIAIYAKEIINESYLTVELSGGRGEDGQHGGNGGEGKNGAGITETELESTRIKYNSLYRDRWSGFTNYHPGSDWTCIHNQSSGSDDYIYRIYKDNKGRELIYSFAGDKGWIYTTYELVFWIKGSDGTNGTSGGRNGLGGEGGYAGTCTIMNPETGTEFDEIRIVRNSGESGKNGTIGKSGTHGTNGNHLALIDRSAKEPSKHIQGGPNVRLAVTYCREATYWSRLIGPRRYVDKNSACFLKFGTNEIDKTSRRANKAEERTTRTNASRAVAKQSVIGEEILNQAESTRKQFTAEEFVQYVKKTGRKTPPGTAAQIMFDLFSVELTSDQLRSVGVTFFHRINFCKAVKSKFSLALIAALQSRIVNGKSFEEIVEFSKDVFARKERKKQTTIKRDKLKDLFQILSQVKNNTDLSIQHGAEVLTGISEEKVKQLVDEFFDEYVELKAEIEFLGPLYEFWQGIPTEFKIFFEKLRRNDVNWADKQKSWNQKVVEESKELTARFDEIPGFKSGWKDTGKNLFSKLVRGTNQDADEAASLVRLYFLAERMLPFNQKLYNCTNLSRTQFGDPKSIKAVEDIATYLRMLRTNPVDLTDDRCENEMKSRGLASRGFLYLLSIKLEIQICIYKKVGYQKLIKIDEFKPQVSNKKSISSIVLWAEDDLIYGIGPDKDYRDLIDAQNSLLKQYQPIIEAELLSIKQKDFSTIENQALFAKFFPKSLFSPVIEYVEDYIALTNDQKLIHLLYNRFYVDGCHLTVFELQFIFDSVALLISQYRANLNWLLLLTYTVPQNELVNIFLYTRITFHQGARLSNSNIYSGIELINNSRFKALLAVKIREHGSVVLEDELYKVILMLQHAASGSNSLIKYGFQEWIELSKKQKWSEIGALLKKYSSVGYYLGVLDSKGLKEEEESMRHIFDQVNLIPERLIALITNFIVNKDVKADKEYFKQLRAYLITANDFPGSKYNDGSKYRLLTGEEEQAELLEWMKKKAPKETNILFPEKPRSIEDLAEMINGLHDVGDEAKKNRRIKSWEIANLFLNSKESIKDSKKHLYWLEKYDAALKSTTGKNLRPTQKMAIMYALESEGNLLEQVNTGEGKSFIIAGIACIRIKTGFKTVDIITSSPVLARRDAEDMKSLYSKMGISVNHNCDEELELRKKAYKANVVYGDIARFQRDYLLHTFYKKPILGDRTRVAVVVDEVDNMLLDNGNNMLYLSHNVPGLNLLDSLLIFIQRQVFEPLYDGSKASPEELQSVFDSKAIKEKILFDLFGTFSEEDLKKLVKGKTKEQLSKLYEKLIKGGILEADGYLKVYRSDQLNLVDKSLEGESNELILKIKACLQVILSRDRQIELAPYLRPFAKLHLDEFIENCKHALFLKPDTEYVVDVDHTGTSTSLEPMVTIIDSNTGADLATSQWSGGLHQFLQLKHGCRISPISLKAVFISNVAYLKGYKQINGLSGTLGSIEESKTLIDLYGADLIKIPTASPKLFYEHVPVMASKNDEWFSNIYKEICDQASVDRSVLVICETIEQVQKVNQNLIERFKTEKNPNNKIQDCFNNITVYQREFDEFDFEGDKKFECSRLIIATNLAGRGTDIKLSEKLIEKGGLHVITTFLPRNCRIEEQAYGRAGRCGQPGSAQIIALIDSSDDLTAKPTVFQLKMFRDNAEIHRLQQLKTFYDFHTEIEERCLEKFRIHCDQALGAVYGAKLEEGDLPDSSQIMYFALLDQWALWLDSKSPAISQCAKDCNNQDKEDLISSVDDFVKCHQSKDFAEFLKWVDAPQVLLTLGIIFIQHKEGLSLADSYFDKIISMGHEFAAEGHYYKGLIRMNNFSGSVSKELNTFRFDQPKEFTADIEKAEENLFKARTLFLQRIQKKLKEASWVTQMVQKTASNGIKTSGFMNQQESIVKYLQLIVKNIDYLIGAPIAVETFKAGDITEIEAKIFFEGFERQGVVSPVLFSESKEERWQIESLKRKYKIGGQIWKEILMDYQADKRCGGYFDSLALEKSLMTEKARLSTRSWFFGQLESMGTLFDIEVVLYIDHEVKGKLPKNFAKINPVKLPNKTESILFVRLSNQEEFGEMYTLKEVNELMSVDQESKEELQNLLESGYLKPDKIAKVNVLKIKSGIGFFDEYDGVTLEDLGEFFGIDSKVAAWILSVLEENGVLTHQSLQMTQDLATELYDYLVKENLLESYVYNIWRLESKLDCSSLPKCIANEIDEFLADRFAFTFALENLMESVDNSLIDTDTKKQICLPMDPTADLINDLSELGLAMPQRIYKDEWELIDFDDYNEHEETLRAIFCSNRFKLRDQTDYHLAVTSFEKYARNSGFFPDAEMKAIVENGIRVVITEKTEDEGWSLMNSFIKCVAKCWNGVKSAAKAVTNFGYQVIKFGATVINKTLGVVGTVASTTAGFLRNVAEFVVGEKIVASCVDAVTYVSKEIGYTALEATEWVIDKTNKVASKVNEKIQEGISWVGDTTLVKSLSKMGKDIGSYIASTGLYKSIASKATYIFNKISSFCTAVMESYHYYNQTRTAARRLALEQRCSIDEHKILRAYHGIKMEEQKKEEAENKVVEDIQISVNDDRESVIELLYKIFEKKRSSSMNQVPEKLLMSILTSGSGSKKFKVELKDCLTCLAWKKQLNCFKVLKDVKSDNKVKSVKGLLPEVDLEDIELFLLEEAIDSVINEIEEQLSDEGYKSENSDDENIGNNWISIIENSLKEVIVKEVEKTFIQPSIKILTAFFSNSGESFFQSIDPDDLELKEAIGEYSMETRIKGKAPFLTTELHSIFAEALGSKDSINKSVLKMAIKYGYPLPIKTATTLADLLHQVAIKNNYSAGFTLQLVNDSEIEGENTIFEYSLTNPKGKSVVKIKPYYGVLFICQNDFYNCFGAEDSIDISQLNPFIFESYVNKLKNMKNKFPKDVVSQGGITIEIGKLVSIRGITNVIIGHEVCTLLCGRSIGLPIGPVVEVNWRAIGPLVAAVICRCEQTDPSSSVERTSTVIVTAGGNA